MNIFESIFNRRFGKDDELSEVAAWRELYKPVIAAKVLQQHRVYGEREQFKRKTDELREVLGLPAWEWRD